MTTNDLRVGDLYRGEVITRVLVSRGRTTIWTAAGEFWWNNGSVVT